MSTKTSNNGKAPAAVATAAAELQEPKAGEPSLAAVTENGALTGIEQPEPKAPSIQDRLAKLNEMTVLAETWDKFRNHLQRVEQMKFGDLDDQSIITITTQSGTAYTIKSGYLCQKIAAVLKEEFTAKIKEIDAQLVW